MQIHRGALIIAVVFLISQLFLSLIAHQCTIDHSLHDGGEDTCWDLLILFGNLPLPLIYAVSSLAADSPATIGVIAGILNSAVVYWIAVRLTPRTRPAP